MEISINKTVKMIVLILALAAWALPAEAAMLYRYINEKGYQEIGYSIPPKMVPNGYDVIDERGRLIRRVAAQLSEEEYAIKLERERRLEACQQAMEQVQRRYEKLADIDKAEHQYQKQLEERLGNDQANLEYSRTALSGRQERAARLERKGTAIPAHLLDNISRTELQIQTLTTQIEGRRSGGVDKAMEFAEERRMFQLGECNPDRLASLN